MNATLPSKINFSQIKGFIFDLDGTLYLGEQALPGAVKLLTYLRQKEKSVLFVSNKPLFPRKVYAAKLTALGIPTSDEQVLTSGYVLGHYLSKEHPDLSYYVIGEENLKKELHEHGLSILPEFESQDEKTVIDASDVDAIIVAFDRTLDYRKLNTAYQALIQGARFFATNPDKTCPMPGGGIPDAGATLAALEHLTGRQVELMAGKPSRLMMQVAMEQMVLPPENCLMTGDRLETDIRMGIDAGMSAAVVLTGASTREQALKANPQPDLILNNVGDLLDLME